MACHLFIWPAYCGATACPLCSAALNCDLLSTIKIMSCQLLTQLFSAVMLVANAAPGRLHSAGCPSTAAPQDAAAGS